ncbi:MAG: hypothetical protein H7255_05765 [Ramlibacter sp.]|nr:hypothetical protein [Ramlibacter sp.]
MLFELTSATTIEEIVDWYTTAESALLKERTAAHTSILAGVIPSHLLRPLPRGATPGDVDDYFRNCLKEIELAANLFLVAAAEARLRRDAQGRQKSGRSSLDDRLSLLHREAQTAWHVPLYEMGLLDAWKDYIGTIPNVLDNEKSRWLSRVGDFKFVLRLRHWVAHGRYWELSPSVDAFPFAMVVAAVEKMFIALNDVATRGAIPTVK